MPTRATAKICPLAELLKGEYITQEGWEPNYVQVGDTRISRINVIGLVVEKVSTNTFIVDDGTGSIRVTDFNQQTTTSELQVGDPVLIIGRPRQAEGELFLAGEIITSNQLKNEPEWLMRRQQQLQEFQPAEKKISTRERETHTEQLTGDDVVEFIRKKDTGDGCQTEEIISYFGTDGEEIINTLLSMGEVYEIRVGVLKVLE